MQYSTDLLIRLLRILHYYFSIKLRKSTNHISKKLHYYFFIKPHKAAPKSHKLPSNQNLINCQATKIPQIFHKLHIFFFELKSHKSAKQTQNYIILFLNNQKRTTLPSNSKQHRGKKNRNCLPANNEMAAGGQLPPMKSEAVGGGPGLK